MTNMRQHAEIVFDICCDARLKPIAFRRGETTITVIVALDGRNPQWLQARLAKEAGKRGVKPYGVTFSYVLDEHMRLEFTPAASSVEVEHD